MPTTFKNPITNPDRRLGVTAFDEAMPVRSWPDQSAVEKETVIRAIYRQVLGNAYVMESERPQTLESQFCQGDISVVDFIRGVACSDLYRTRFFENGPRNRFIELNFKHFLGRAPESQAEVAAHSRILDEDGYESEISAYLDSAEYADVFGPDTVPYYRGYKTRTGQKLVGFTHMFPLLRGASSSDKQVTFNNPARLNRAIFSGQASPVVSPSGAIARRDTSPAGASWIQAIYATTSKPTSTAQSAPTSGYEGMDEPELRAKEKEQQALIEQLQKQLDGMQSLSSMGAAILRKGQVASAAEVDPYAQRSQDNGRTPSLTDKIKAQKEKIDQLRGELMTARSLSTIAEAKLNKWRQRSY